MLDSRKLSLTRTLNDLFEPMAWKMGSRKTKNQAVHFSRSVALQLEPSENDQVNVIRRKQKRRYYARDIIDSRTKRDSTFSKYPNGDLLHKRFKSWGLAIAVNVPSIVRVFQRRDGIQQLYHGEMFAAFTLTLVGKVCLVRTSRLGIHPPGML